MGDDLGQDIQTTPRVNPTKVFGKAIATSFCWDSDTEEAPAAILNECRLLVHYKAGGAYVGKRMIGLNPSVIKDAMEADYLAKSTPVLDAAVEAAYQPAYDEAIADEKTELEAGVIAEAAANNAGAEALAAAGIKMGDPEATFKAAAAKIIAGDSAKALVDLMGAKAWGKIIFNAAWDNTR